MNTNSTEAEISLEKKSAKIHEMFSKVAPQYDRANSWLSMGIHHQWRKYMIQNSGIKAHHRVLDCATGTGDVALEIKRQCPKAQITATDFCQPMLDLAWQKAQDSQLDILFQKADITSLPFESNQFDFVTVSFGLRNVENLTKGLQELHRVLKPGGHLLVLEFGRPTGILFPLLFDFYSRNILPWFGGFITGQPQAYKYLNKSSEQFPCRDEFCTLMTKEGGFSVATYRPLTSGIAYFYRGAKI